MMENGKRVIVMNIRPQRSLPLLLAALLLSLTACAGCVERKAGTWPDEAGRLTVAAQGTETETSPGPRSDF